MHLEVLAREKLVLAEHEVVFGTALLRERERVLCPARRERLDALQIAGERLSVFIF
jgi:hypothetical protein